MYKSIYLLTYLLTAVDAGAGFGGEAQYYGASGPSSTNGYLDTGTGQYAQPDNSYNPSEYTCSCSGGDSSSSSSS